MLHNKWLLLQAPPILSPSSIFASQSSYQKGTSSGPQQPSTAVSTLLGFLQLLSWSLAAFDPSLATDKQQTSWPCQAFTDAQTNRQTDSFTDTHSLQEIDSLMCGYSRSGMKTASEWACDYNLSFLPISHTTTHMSVNGVASRAPSGNLSSTTHGVHHFLSNSPFPIVNTHLCTIRRASSRLIHTHTHTHTHTICRVFTHTHTVLDIQTHTSAWA